MDRDARIFVAGHRGMVGSALLRRLKAGGYTRLLAPARDELDLLDQRAVHAYLAEHRPDYIFIAAAKVGGIQANNEYRAEFLYQNLMIEANLIHGAHLRMTHSFLQRKEVEFNALRRTIESLRAELSQEMGRDR